MTGSGIPEPEEFTVLEEARGPGKPEIVRSNKKAMLHARGAAQYVTKKAVRDAMEKTGLLTTRDDVGRALRAIMQVAKPINDATSSTIHMVHAQALDGATSLQKTNFQHFDNHGPTAVSTSNDGFLNYDKDIKGA